MKNQILVRAKKEYKKSWRMHLISIERWIKGNPNAELNEDELTEAIKTYRVYYKVFVEIAEELGDIDPELMERLILSSLILKGKFDYMAQFFLKQTIEMEKKNE